MKEYVKPEMEIRSLVPQLPIASEHNEVSLPNFIGDDFWDQQGMSLISGCVLTVL